MFGGHVNVIVHENKTKTRQCGGYLDVLAQISMGSAGRGQVFLPGEDAVDERVCLWGHVNVIVHENKTKTRQCGGYLDVLAQISMGSAGRGQVFFQVRCSSR